jgi:putative aminopeptidase FrvX
LLTRSEEDGFIGCLAACIKPKLLRKTDIVISIETSAEQPYAQQGNGVIIRIGDRLSVFNSSLLYFMNHQAENLQSTDRAFKFQRALMPGGACEATVYDIYGFTTGAACVPLGNYHNMDRKKKKIAPEYINVSDWDSMVKLFVHLGRTGHDYKPGHQILRKKIEEKFHQMKHYL